MYRLYADEFFRRIYTIEASKKLLEDWIFVFFFSLFKNNALVVDGLILAERNFRSREIGKKQEFVYHP